ncbi:hypothetical protein JCM30471_09580 [Desulfuromonas carbonis]|uniref:cupin domain-containing protein n=1 Tax=Desulfuromonas sp. DDH964 TaxID=1823759 RepID=UPI00078B527F|nr:cupin domain-containing protein [Desulfuromonas sp. DDH964]AMV72443.1 cupin [Desulfuromonas sp. DDH964]
MARIEDEAALPWQPVRPQFTQGVFGKTLLDGATRIVLTRVAPGGSFAEHADSYDHLFYILEGVGLVAVADREFPVAPGSIVRVVAGERHGYRNSGSDDLLLISVNIPRS